MIVKYLDGDTWVYLDNVIKTTAKYEDAETEVRKYDKMASEKTWENEVVISKKIFFSVTQDCRDIGDNVRYENLISPSTIGCPIKTLTLFVKDRGKFDTVILVTNQMAYLMNDQGQTIERLN